jgi:hypothetical protein
MEESMAFATVVETAVEFWWVWGVAALVSYLYRSLVGNYRSKKLVREMSRNRQRRSASPVGIVLFDMFGSSNLAESMSKITTFDLTIARVTFWTSLVVFCGTTAVQAYYYLQ